MSRGESGEWSERWRVERWGEWGWDEKCRYVGDGWVGGGGGTVATVRAGWAAAVPESHRVLWWWCRWW